MVERLDVSLCYDNIYTFSSIVLIKFNFITIHQKEQKQSGYIILREKKRGKILNLVGNEWQKENKR